VDWRRCTLVKALTLFLLSLCFCHPIWADEGGACLNESVRQEVQKAVRDLQVQIPEILKSVQEMNIRIPEIQVHVPEIRVQIPKIQIPEMRIEAPVSVEVPKIEIPEMRLQIPEIHIQIPKCPE
jgi:hypothetical protein